MLSALSRIPRPRLLQFACIAAFAVAAGGCAGPPVPSPISGEPLCPDYEVGITRTKMQGSLRHPVKLTIRDGNTQVITKMVLGRRTEHDQPLRILLIDSNEEYIVEWAQCENERATKPVGGGGHAEKEAAHYECGAAAVYSSEKLITRKGDIATHAVTFVAPPKPQCWESDMPTPAAADAGAPDTDGGALDTDAAAPPVTGDAGAEAADASAPPVTGDAGSQVADASAPTGTSDAGPTADAGSVEPAADAGSDVGASKDDAKKKKAKKPASP